MAVFCRSHTKPIENERAFCQALLNNENPIWDDTINTTKIRKKKGFRLPPDDFIYGLKHPKQDGITGVAAALQQYCTVNDAYTSSNIPQITSIPNFIAINKAAARLGLTKVHDIHQYRRTMNNTQLKINPCYCLHTEKKLIPDIIYGRVTSKQQSIRELIENKYQHDWIYKNTIRRCKEILNSDNSKLTNKSIKMTKASLLKQNFNMRK